MIDYHFLLAFAYASAALDHFAEGNLRASASDGAVAVIYLWLGIADGPFGLQ